MDDSISLSLETMSSLAATVDTSRFIHKKNCWYESEHHNRFPIVKHLWQKIT